MSLEHEMKIPVRSLEEVRGRLRERGAMLEHAATFEENWVLDDPAGTMAARGCLLRVRRCGGRATLTFKGPASFTGSIKTREELETSLGDAAIVVRLLGRLGFVPARRYQKRRELWRRSGVAVALDETPMGCFVELEGDPATLAGVAADLGLDPAAALAGTYLRLWEIYRLTHPEAPTDMVFERSPG